MEARAYPQQVDKLLMEVNYNPASKDEVATFWLPPCSNLTLYPSFPSPT